MGLSDAVILMENGTGSGSDKIVQGGHYAFMAEATFGGGTVKLQIKLPQGAYADVTSISLSAAGMVAGFLPPGTYRAVATTATAAYARVVRIPY